MVAKTATICVGMAALAGAYRESLWTGCGLVTAAAFFGDRLDVGIGRSPLREAPGARPRRNGEEFKEACRRVGTACFGGDARPCVCGDGVQVWMHGTSRRSEEVAVELDYNYCHGLAFRLSDPSIDRCLETTEFFRDSGSAASLGVAPIVILRMIASIVPKRTLPAQLISGPRQLEPRNTFGKRCRHS